MSASPLALAQYKQIVIMTGAGISAGSGLPTYRGAGGLWDTVDVASHATAEAISHDPSKVWSFFSAIRRQIAQAQPNPGHLAIARAEHLPPSRPVSDRPDAKCRWVTFTRGFHARR